MKDLILDSKLYRELDKRARKKHALSMELRGLIDASLETMQAVLSDIRRYFYTYTDHSMAHSCRVVNNMSSLLSEKQVAKLTPVELYLLIAGALAHDIGMVVSEREIGSLLKSDEYTATKAAVCRQLGIDLASADDRHGLFRVIVAEHIRARHGVRCAFVLDEQLFDTLKLTGGDAELTRKLSAICVGHTLRREEISGSELYKTEIQVRNTTVNMLFCTILLRIGDLLDITTSRASPVIRELSEPLEPLSASHWDQYKEVELGVLKPRRPIYIGGTCPTQAAERLLREWVKLLEDECEWAVLTLNSCDDPFYLELGRIDYAVRPERDCHNREKYEFHNYRFNLDEEEVFKKLFGERLYGRPDSALRELLQNAIDATRVRAVLRCAVDPSWNRYTEPEKRERYLAQIDSDLDQSTLRVGLSVKPNAKTGLRETWLSVKDAGVGMSREVIEKYLLKVGRSRWRDDPRTRSIGIGTIGEFGIGFISVFMISDRVEILTQSCLPNDGGILATIYSWKGYLATEPIDLPEPGTEIRLLLKPEIAQQMHDLPHRVDYWCPFPEVPIEVVGLDGIPQRIAVRGRKPYSAEERRIYFRIGDGFSFASIAETKSPLTESSPPSLAQDGIAIPDVPPPQLDTVEQQTLRKRLIRVNLVGSDGTRLDLSRNITEGGYDQLWARLIPMIWQGLARTSLRTKAGRYAFSEFVQQLFEQSKGTAAILLKSERDLWYGDITNLPEHETLSFADYTAPSVGPGDGQIEDLLVLPEPPLALMSGFDPVHSDNDELNDAFRYWVRAGQHADHNSTFETSEPLSMRTFRKYYKIIFQRYKFASKSKSGHARLHISPPAEGYCEIDRLGIFRLTDNWWAICDPISGEWQMINQYDFEFALNGIPSSILASLSFEQIVTVYLYDLWPSTEKWKAGWPSMTQAKYGDSISRIFLSVRAKDLQEGIQVNVNEYDEYEQEEQDDEIDLELDDDEPPKKDRNTSGYYDNSENSDEGGDDEELELPYLLEEASRDRRAQRHGLQDHDSMISDLISNIFPRLDSSCLSPCLTPWDREAWLAGHDQIRKRR